jgi:hypothetical protein
MQIMSLLQSIAFVHNFFTLFAAQRDLHSDYIKIRRFLHYVSIADNGRAC